MAGISNYTPHAKRKWYDGNNWHTDNIDFVQLASKTIYSGRDITFKPEEHTDILFSSNRKVYNYTGLIYKPKKYYKATEILFSEKEFSDILNYIKSAFVDYPSEDYRHYFNADVSSLIPFYNEETGYYSFLVGKIAYGAMQGILPQKRNILLRFNYISTKYKPTEIRLSPKYNDSGSYVSDVYRVYENGNWRDATGNDYVDFGFIIDISKVFSFQEWTEYINSLFNSILKTKFYFIVSPDGGIIDTTSNTSRNYNTNSASLYAAIFMDVSNFPQVINPSFIYTNFIYYYNSNNRKSLYDVTIDTRKSPEPTLNPDDDDPNDDDPGSQTGKDDDDDDEGGDGDHDDTSDTIPDPPLPSISGTSNGLITAWNISPSQLAALAKKLWSPDAWEAIKQYFTNPMDAILSLSIIPVEPKTSSGVIHLGGYNTEISSNKLNNDYIKFDCGSIAINRYYGSYLDYDPFTKISCYLPYVGEVDIDPDQVMQKTLSIKYHINCITGECVAYLLADNSVFANYSGNCAKQMPICQTDFSSIISSSLQLCSTLITAGASAGIGGAEKSLFDATLESTKASESLVKAQSSLLGSVMSAKMNYKHSSQLGTGAGQLAPQFPFLTIMRPNLDLAENYKAYTGYPCNKNLLLSSVRGFTIAEAANLSVPSASLEEISEIKELLLKGVIL